MKIHGYCPMGCGETLMVEVSVAGAEEVVGRVVCRYVACPNSDKVNELLADDETEHVVEFTETSYSTQHPLRERGDDLFACKLHVAIGEHFDSPPVEPGRYRVTWHRHDPVSESFASDAHPFEFERVS